MNQLGLFAKFWQPGAVKTRLAATIGNVPACDLYQSFLLHLIRRLGAIGDQRTVVFCPANRQVDFRQSIPTSWSLCPQVTGSLGVRMKRYFQHEFANSRNRSQLGKPIRIVVIGADCPQLDAQMIQTAFEKLDDAPVVIGPSTDGGYYLLGMRNQCFEIFDDINWGSDSVLQSTMEKLDQSNVDYETLPRLTDVDEFDDLIALETYLSEYQSSSSELLSFLKNVRRSIADHQTGNRSRR